MIKKINHIGIAVKDLDKAIDFYRKLGLEVSSTEVVESQKVKIAFIPVGDTRLELLAATSEDSPIAKFIEKKGEGIQHIALDVDDVKAHIQNAIDNEIEPIDKEPRPGAHNSLIAFLHPKYTGGVLLEFCQES
ncbi:MAG: methylmalonyl-CoA epimerase [Candidatus Cloacimonetes bacterium]|nr:methylmalonyl-CoA epimerase [Candidatus Cloacimonadota bacterium]